MSLRSIAKRVLPYLPASLQQALRAKSEKSRLAQHAARKVRTQVAVSDVIQQLKEMGLTRDVLVHGSISNIGKLDQPVPVLVDEWLKTLDFSRQTVLVPALPYNTTMREYLAGAPSFDVRTARNAMGAISTIVMGKPGAMRSVHPTHSVVALGAQAKAYTAGHQRDGSPFGINSPYWRLTAQRGQILMIGVGLNSVTCFHVYEDLLGANLPFQVYTSDQFDVPCLDRDGQALTVRTTCHNPKLSAVRDCERARPWLVQSGAIKSYQLGESELSVIDAFLFTKTLLSKLREGESIYGKTKLSKQQRLAIDAALLRLEQLAS